MQIDRKSDRQQNKEAPSQWRSWKQETRSKYPDEQSRAYQAAPEIVKHFPLRDKREWILYFVSVGVRNSWKQPAQELPIAARPTMLTLGVCQVRGRIVIKQFNFSRQGSACKERLEEIVTQQ